MDEQSSGHQDGRVLIRRFASLFVGLWLYGFSMAMMITAGLGLDPWDVFHQGVAEHVSLSFGVITAITGAVVLLLWIPIRQRPGFGTVANVVVIAISVDTSLAFLPVFDSMPVRAAIMVAGILLNGLASVLYIGAGMGPGPRDGLYDRTGGAHRLVGQARAYQHRNRGPRYRMAPRWNRRRRNSVVRLRDRTDHSIP